MLMMKLLNYNIAIHVPQKLKENDCLGDLCLYCCIIPDCHFVACVRDLNGSYKKSSDLLKEDAGSSQNAGPGPGCLLFSKFF